MTFVPPRCPNVGCPFHQKPAARFCIRRGSYQPKCRNRPIQRFRCRLCKLSFSEQTFRHDYRDRCPEANVPLFELLISGVGLRQAGRILRLDIHSVQRKMLKLSRTCWLLHDNLSPKLPGGLTFLLDEEETYEQASIRPVTMPVLIERSTWFVTAIETGPIRRLAKQGTARRARQDREELRFGRRPDKSAKCVRKVLRALRQRVTEGPVTLLTDKKATYPSIAARFFGDRLLHVTTSSKLHRGMHNPLFPINTTLAMTRDNMGRLRRKSWLVSKKHERLRAHAGLFVAYRNYVRPRFNRDQEHQSPAHLLKLVPRALEIDETLRWRQDWGPHSIHPMSRLARTVVSESARLTAESQPVE